MNSLKNKRLSAILDSHSDILSEWHRTAPIPSAISKYGITRKQWEDMAHAQGYCCAICKTKQPKKRMAVDHCHDTGKVRGLLCSSCNMALGMIKDNILIAESLIRYLKDSK